MTLFNPPSIPLRPLYDTTFSYRLFNDLPKPTLRVYVHFCTCD